MARDEAYRKAEQKIEEARRSGAKKLDFSIPWSDKETPKLTELPESLGQLTQLQSLDLANNQLAALPEWLGQLTQLQSLNLADNQLTALPESLGQLAQLQTLSLSSNQLTALPESLGQLKQLQTLDLSRNRLTTLPEWASQLTQLQSLGLSGNQLTTLPEWLGQLTNLRCLDLSYLELTEAPRALRGLTSLTDLTLHENRLRSLPEWFGELNGLTDFSLGGNPVAEMPSPLRRLQGLRTLNLWNCGLREVPEWIGELSALTILNIQNISGDVLDKSANKLTDVPVSLLKLERLGELRLLNNPLNPELAGAYKEGLDAVKRYLRAKAEAQVVLNEAKLILIGEGEVGKSCLLGALRGDSWEEGRPTTHGIEIKPVKVTDPATGTEITLNGWDFGGQRVYRPTHQLFFSAPAVYLVVWKPREGPQQGFVKEWIKLVKHREPDAKVLVVATHGGPKERQPDIDRQEIIDLFGRDTVLGFFHVESKPDVKTGERKGITDLKKAIAQVAAGLPEMGRKVPKRWEEARKALTDTDAAYLPLEHVLKLCHDRKMEEKEAKDFVRISHRLGHLIHYEHDPALRGIVVLKPDWLATAMSFVLDDKQTREDGHGLVSFARLGKLWNDPERPQENRYPPNLHPVFLRLMERFDLSYRVAEAGLGQSNRISLIAQLVPDLRPDPVPGWAACAGAGDGQQVQICRIAETRNGQSAAAEGLFYQLIVRLHKYSLGRVNYKESVHWQRGLVLDDDYNGRALLEHIGNDVRITVRAPYPEALLAVLTHEVKWLVENFWKGLRCDVMVPCTEPCGRNAPGTGLFEVQKLIESKRRGRPEYPCPVCDDWQNIDCLLRNAPAARPGPLEELLAEFAMVKAELIGARRQLTALRGEAMGRFDKLDLRTQRILSKVDNAFTGLMRALTDEAKDGPRLFSLHPVERSAFNPKGWVKKRFRVTLWCEHSRLPLPLLNKHDREGVYEFDVTQEWFEKAAPLLKVLTGTLSLVLPVAASAAKLGIEEEAYKAMEDRLTFGKDCVDAMLQATEKTVEWADESEGPGLEREGVIRARGAELRQLQAWLKEKDPGFGGLVRVQNKRQEFLWVHPQFEKEY